MKPLLALFTAFFLLASCTPQSAAYRSCYAYLKERPQEGPYVETPYYIVLLVNARHLDYSDADSFLKTCMKHPSDGSKNGDVGHAWIYLKGPGKVIEGGQSGETGLYQPRFLDGILDNVRYGAKDPVRYLWCSQSDGYFERGSGGHRPTFAAKVDLTEEQYSAILCYIEAYDFSEYNLIGHQCTTFVRGAAALAGLELKDEEHLPLPKTLIIDGKRCPLWQSECYSILPCGSPDRLERSLYEAVREGKAQNVTSFFVPPRGYTETTARRGCRGRLP